MDNIILILQGIIIAYMDDIVVFCYTIHDHISNLDDIFIRRQTSDVKIKPDKCEFLRKKVSYLEHLFTKDGVRPNPSKVELVQNFPTSPQPQKN